MNGKLHYCDGWELGDVEALEQKYPGKFQAPSALHRHNLYLHDVVNLVFIQPHDEERNPHLGASLELQGMWVRVIEKIADRYRGKLESRPEGVQALKTGQVIEFGPEHVAATLLRKSDPRHPCNQSA